MKRRLALFLGAALLAAPAEAQRGRGRDEPPTSAPAPSLAESGRTRLEVVATGEATRTPDVVRIGAGVVTQAPNAQAALGGNSTRMERVIAALRRAGVEARDIQTSSVSLQPDYAYVNNQPPRLTGFRASNEVTVRFRDIARTGAILDALVAQGANQINGPSFELDRPEEALDEARRAALAAAGRRAALYAGAIGKRVGRILLISEADGTGGPRPSLRTYDVAVQAASAPPIAPGESRIAAQLTVVYELE